MSKTTTAAVGAKLKQIVIWLGFGSIILVAHTCSTGFVALETSPDQGISATTIIITIIESHLIIDKYAVIIVLVHFTEESRNHRGARYHDCLQLAAGDRVAHKDRGIITMGAGLFK